MPETETMKFSKILFLIIALGVGSTVYAQVKPATTPVASPTPPQSNDIFGTALKTKTTQVTGLSAQTQKQLEAASKLMQDGNHEESVAAHSNIIKSYPNIMIAYNNRGYSYMQLGKLDLAIADFNTALKLSPT